MYPVLFHIADMPVHSYYLLWTAALMVSVATTRRRMTLYYGMDDDTARIVIIWCFIGMLFGARAGSVYDSWPLYSSDPVRILRFWEGGLSSVPAFLAAGGVAFFNSAFRKIPFWKIVDAAALPAALTVAIGRWGCFLNGCCTGVQTSVPWAVHFPADAAGVLRHPTQLYYAFGALLITAVLQWTEATRLGYGEDRRIEGAVLCPLFSLSYSLLRIFVDPYRAEFTRIGLQTNRSILIVVAAGSILWLLHSLLRRKRSIRNL
jgi:phosphatidylglycerol:prolipoprotein diacylglycerol transferase